jgi:LemA protein
MPFVLAFGAALFLLLILMVVLTTFNSVVALQKRVDKALANVDVVLKQRHDELPNLVEAVKGLMAFERSVLEEVTRLRAAYQPEDPLPKRAATADATTQAVRSLFAVMERYPDIKSQANVLSLQQEIERLETVIALRREFYNDSVYLYNTTIRQAPAVILAGTFGWQPRVFFEAEAGDAARPAVGLAAGGSADPSAAAGADGPGTDAETSAGKTGDQGTA